MSILCWMASLLAFGILPPRAVQTPQLPSGPWTPARVLTFVLHAESEMGKLQFKLTENMHNNAPGTCGGMPLNVAIRKSEAMPRIEAVVTGKALPCYVATYLGCDVGDWLGDNYSRRDWHGPDLSPYTKSNVTIIEQGPDRVLADVTEVPTECVLDGVATVTDNDNPRPATQAELADVTDVSRYTIERGKDGVWRISDRKPSFEWDCHLNDHPPRSAK